MATMNLTAPPAWGTDPERVRGPALMMGAHGLSARCPTTAPNVDLYFSSLVGAGSSSEWGPAAAQIPSFADAHPHPAPFGFHYVPDDPGGFITQQHPAFQSPSITKPPPCPTTTTAAAIAATTGQFGNNSSGNGYFPHHAPVAPVTWATEHNAVTSISERSLFSFQHQLRPGDTTIRTTDAPSFSPGSTHSPLHSPTFTASPGGRNVSWSASSCASSPPPPCEKSGDDYFSTSSAVVPTDPNNSNNNNNNNPDQQPAFKPGSRVIAASPMTAQSQTQTLEEYESSRRLWHNQIGKKYRNKLNEQFENLQVVLRLYDEDDEDTDTEGPNVSIKGRSINKAKLLNMARQRLEELMNERKAWRQEKRELMENLGMSEE
ncbi:hypothetical protein QBC41DRAFT_14627 [Cercophora samala]|uniref:BHLH domain-containing protein n=1 Tax=Cercophora samala TaxID=330535 RepID=A0AA39Z714_9PEZI|nr:hypothetical protein QBC41DRAFT_14627 [Cercophora samala]